MEEKLSKVIENNQEFKSYLASQTLSTIFKDIKIIKGDNLKNNEILSLSRKLKKTRHENIKKDLDKDEEPIYMGQPITDFMPLLYLDTGKVFNHQEDLKTYLNEERPYSFKFMVPLIEYYPVNSEEKKKKDEYFYKNSAFTREYYNGDTSLGYGAYRSEAPYIVKFMVDKVKPYEIVYNDIESTNPEYIFNPNNKYNYEELYEFMKKVNPNLRHKEWYSIYFNDLNDVFVLSKI